jgi:hypothetical protein
MVEERNDGDSSAEEESTPIIWPDADMEEKLHQYIKSEDLSDRIKVDDESSERNNYSVGFKSESQAKFNDCTEEEFYEARRKFWQLLDSADHLVDRGKQEVDRRQVNSSHDVFDLIKMIETDTEIPTELQYQESSSSSISIRVEDEPVFDEKMIPSGGDLSLEADDHDEEPEFNEKMTPSEDDLRQISLVEPTGLPPHDESIDEAKNGSRRLYRPQLHALHKIRREWKKGMVVDKDLGITYIPRNRPSIVNRDELFYRFGEREREACACFNFLDELAPTNTTPFDPTEHSGDDNFKLQDFYLH